MIARRFALLVSISLPFHLSGCTCGGDTPASESTAPAAIAPAPESSAEDDASAAPAPDTESATAEEGSQGGAPRIDTEALRRDLERTLQQRADQQLRLAPEGSFQLQRPVVPPPPTPRPIDAPSTP